MADPRFYDNRGPFTLGDVCKAVGAALPSNADAAAKIQDIASLAGAGPDHLTFYAGGKPDELWGNEAIRAAYLGGHAKATA